MSADLSILVGAYLRDLLTQPQAVADTVAGLRSLGPLPARALACERIVLTGMGSSLHAQHPRRCRDPVARRPGVFGVVQNLSRHPRRLPGGNGDGSSRPRSAGADR